MFNLFNRRRRRQASFQPLEALEVRLLLAAVNVTSTPGPNRSVNLSFIGSPEQDIVQLGLDSNQMVKVSAFIPGSTTFKLNGGAEVQELTFRAVNNLTFNLGNGVDGAFVAVPAGNITINDGADGSFSRYGIFNDNRPGSSLVHTKVGDIQANFWGGQVFFDVTASTGSTGLIHSLRTGKLAINLVNTSQSEINLTAEEAARLNIQGQLIVSSPAAIVSRDTVNILAKSGNSPVMGQVNLLGGSRLNTGGGDDVVNSRGAVTFKGTTSVNLGAGDDLFQVRSGSLEGSPKSKAVNRFNGPVTINSGEGGGNVSVASAVGYDKIQFAGGVSIIGSSQANSVEFWRADFLSNLTIQTGGATGPVGDSVKLSNTDVFGTSRIVALGTAQVDIDSAATFQGAEPTRFRKAATFSLGAGAVVIGRDMNSHVIFDRTQTFTGSVSQISVSYIGNITADLSKRILNNAILV